MYITGINPRPDYHPVESKGKRKSAQGGAFADSMASAIEMDVVEIGHATDDETKKDLPHFAQQQNESNHAPEGDGERKSGLDIKV